MDVRIANRAAAEMGSGVVFGKPFLPEISIQTLYSQTDESAVHVDVAGSIHAELIRETFQIAKEFRAGQRNMCNRIIDRLT